MILVLVVDDIPAMAEQYAYDLKRLGGFDTIAAMGGSEALDIIGREPEVREAPDAAVLPLVSGRIGFREVAFELGYADPYYFSRVYKKHRGHPPSEMLRRRHR